MAAAAPPNSSSPSVTPAPAIAPIADSAETRSARNKRKVTYRDYEDPEHSDEPDSSFEKPARKRNSKKQQDLSLRPKANWKAQYHQLKSDTERSTERLFGYGEKALGEKRFEAAYAYYSAVYELHPRNLTYVIGFCEYFNKIGKADQALELALRTKADPTVTVNAQFLLRLCSYLLRACQWQTALDTVRELLVLTPKDGKAQSCLTLLQSIVGLEEAAREALDRAAWGQLTAIVNRLEMIQHTSTPLWLQWKREAQQNLSIMGMVQRSPEMGIIEQLATYPHYQRGERHLAADQARSAQECYKAQLLSHPHHQPSRLRMMSIELLQRGDAFTDRQKFHEAIDAYTQAMALDRTSPFMPFLFAKRGLALFSADNVHHALEDCENALRLNSQTYRALHLRGLCHVTGGNLKQAVTDLDDALTVFARVQPSGERADWQSIVLDHRDRTQQQLAQSMKFCFSGLVAAQEAPQPGIEVALAVTPADNNEEVKLALVGAAKAALSNTSAQEEPLESA